MAYENLDLNFATFVAYKHPNDNKFPFPVRGYFLRYNGKIVAGFEENAPYVTSIRMKYDDVTHGCVSDLNVAIRSLADIVGSDVHLTHVMFTFDNGLTSFNMDDKGNVICAVGKIESFSPAELSYYNVEITGDESSIENDYHEWLRAVGLFDPVMTILHRGSW